MVSLTTGAQPTETTGSTAPPGSTTIVPYTYATSKIVRTAIAAGIIILALSALILALRITSWIRYRQRGRRQRLMTAKMQSEQRANAYEIAAWADEPGLAPVHPDEKDRRTWGWKDKRRDKKREKHLGKMNKRGGANAFAVKEWEGIAS